jgi:adenylate cyclase class IV
MAGKIIELELRAEIKSREIPKVKTALARLGKFHSQTKRLSVMLFGKTKAKDRDIRIRITNGKSEVVIKSGTLGSVDRVEVAQNISPKQFLGFVRIFRQLGFSAKVGQRQTFNYTFPNNITVSLVLAGKYAYVELEKMSSRKEIKNNTKLLETETNRLGLRLIESEADFEELCDRLSREVDWVFKGSKKDYEKLEKLLEKYSK